jgi:hypothetical protein
MDRTAGIQFTLIHGAFIIIEMRLPLFIVPLSSHQKKSRSKKSHKEGKKYNDGVSGT